MFSPRSSPAHNLFFIIAEFFPEMKGFVKVDRELFESELWTLDLSVRAAYIDLMRRAAWRPVAAFVNGKNLTIEKGQCIVSQRILSDDWACKRSTVVSILRRLVGLNLISLHSIFDDAITATLSSLFVITYRPPQGARNVNQTAPHGQGGSQ